MRSLGFNSNSAPQLQGPSMVIVGNLPSLSGLEHPKSERREELVFSFALTPNSIQEGTW